MKHFLVSLFLFTFFLSPKVLSAQACKRCSELPPPPSSSSSESLLRVYLEGENGVGGNDCWVHCHSNGNDFVITPNSWGANPNPERKALVDMALQAITDSRSVLGNLGTLQRSIYFLLNDITVGDNKFAEAFWPVGDECWIHAGLSDVRNLAQGEQKFVFAHEIGHCFLMNNIEGHSTDSPGYEKWWDESGSEYLASIIYPANNMEHRFSTIYSLDAPFTQAYRAYVLLHHYALEYNQAAVLRLIQGLYDHPGRASRLSFLRRMNFNPLFHQFIYRLARGELPDAGGGSIPHTHPVSFDSYTLKPEQTSIELADILPEQANYFLFSIPAGYDAVFSPIEHSALDITFSTNGIGTYPWVAEYNLMGSCSEETQAALLITHLSDDPIEYTKLEYQLTPKSDCCEGIGGFTAALDPCLTGRWRLDYSSSILPNWADISGDIIVQLASNGQLTAEFDVRRQYNEDDYDHHKGTASGCLVAYPTGAGRGGATFLKVMNAKLGPENQHIECCTRKGGSSDITDEIARWLRHLVFGYLRCDQQTIYGMGGIRLVKVE